VSRVVILTRPIARLATDPMLLARFAHDYSLLQMIQATMPDWHMTWFGRAPHLWQGAEIFYVKLVHALGDITHSFVAMEFLFEVGHDPHLTSVATVLASRKDASPTNSVWVLSDYAKAMSYPLDVEIKLELDIPYQLNYAED